LTDGSGSMVGKVCLVTGATRGLGQAAALELARKGATVVIVGRNRERVKNALAVIRQVSGSTCVEGFQADLSAQADVRRVAAEFQASYPRLDVLINNVGATLLTYAESQDGYEMSWALNYLNHFLLTHLLMGPLKLTAEVEGEARVIEVTSSIYRLARPDFQRLQKRDGYNGVLAYAQSKRAMITFVLELSRRLAGCGVTANAVTPGFVATDIASDSTPWAKRAMRLVRLFSRTLEVGVQPIVHLASSADVNGVTGQYYYRFKQRRPDAGCRMPEHGERLWQISAAMTGLD
jgi:NAD(P)-dependent dehydrogenase (short-subunit alcohol dehydrogenase family)